MDQFLFGRGDPELQLFPHIAEIGLKKNTSIQLDSFPQADAKYMCVYYIIDGKFEWNIAGRQITIFPTDVVYVLPGQKIGGANGVLDIGTLAWIWLKFEKANSERIVPGAWSSLSENEVHAMEFVLSVHRAAHLPAFTEIGRIFQNLQQEFLNREIGYFTRINQLLDELLIVVTRQLTKQNNQGRDFPKKFLQLEQLLRKDLSYKWTVEEMAASVGMGTTLFNERVKNYTGLSPLTYLINIRISEAIKLLKKPELSITDIALDTGFYSSQHFSTTFRKLTGYTPREFRKRNISGDKK